MHKSIRNLGYSNHDISIIVPTNVGFGKKKNHLLYFNYLFLRFKLII
jgi:hypothetical protein